MNGLKPELAYDIREKISSHKERFSRLFRNRYLELLPNVIIYDDKEQTSIDFLKLEVALRHNMNVVVGLGSNGAVMVLGYTTNPTGITDPNTWYQNNVLTKKDITFIVPEKYIPDNMVEITNLDNCQTGNFIVLRNKTVNFVNDYEIIEHYTDVISEVVLSRFSLIIQAKLLTIFKSQPNDETVNELVNAIYNGSPFFKATDLFDEVEQIIKLDNSSLSSNLVELKREYQNGISELNNMLGLSSLGVDKESGVSDTEAKSNQSFTDSNGNIYLNARQNAFKLLNKRFNLSIEARYNDKVVKQINELGGVTNEENNNII